MLLAVLMQAGVAGGLWWWVRHHPTADLVAPPDVPVNDRLVWLTDPGPGGGGGGGGNRSLAPPQQAKAPGRDVITVQTAKAPPVQPPTPPKVEPPPPPPIDPMTLAARSMASGVEATVGVIEAAPTAPPGSLGSGTGRGAGTGSGTGTGAGSGSGLGQGSGGGTGGGVYQPGNGVTLPRILKEVKPSYTPEAMRAKVQGTVLIQCVVRPDGSVSDVQVLRSLDSYFGLDQEAVKAARQWRFAPGLRQGQPVPVQITIELSFTLR